MATVTVKRERMNKRSGKTEKVDVDVTVCDLCGGNRSTNDKSVKACFVNGDTRERELCDRCRQRTGAKVVPV